MVHNILASLKIPKAIFPSVLKNKTVVLYSKDQTQSSQIHKVPNLKGQGSMEVWNFSHVLPCWLLTTLSYQNEDDLTHKNGCTDNCPVQVTSVQPDNCPGDNCPSRQLSRRNNCPCATIVQVGQLSRKGGGWLRFDTKFPSSKNFQTPICHIEAATYFTLRYYLSFAKSLVI